MAIPLTPEQQQSFDQQSNANLQSAPTPPIPAAVPASPVTTPVTPIQPEDAALPQTLTPPQTAPGTFNRNLTSSANSMPVTPEPGSWARSLVGSALNALGGLADASTSPVKNGGGWLEGVTETLANRQARLRQNQIDADNRADRAAANKRADTALSLDQQRTQATLAQATINGLHTALIMRNENEDHQAKLMESAQTASKPFKEMGSIELGRGLSGQEITAMLRDKKLDPTATLHFQDGSTPVIGPDGQQIVKDGVPQTQPTFELLTNVPKVTLGKDQAADLNKYGVLSQPVREGQEMSGEQYFYAHSVAQTNKAVALNVERVQSEIGASDAEAKERRLTVQEKEANDRASNDFAPYLAANNGDAVLALRQMAADPKAKNKIGGVERLYGNGVIEKFRQDTLTTLEKTIEDDTKELDRHTVIGAEKLPQDQIDELNADIATARAQRNLYLGLHPSDPPQFASSVAALDKLPTAQRLAAITDPRAKLSAPAQVYLLKHYGLQIPASLQTQTPNPQPNGGR